MNDDTEAGAGRLEKSDPRERGFLPETLDRAVIAVPLLRKLEVEESDPTAEMTLYDVIIDVNYGYRPNREAALQRVYQLMSMAIESVPVEDGRDRQVIDQQKTDLSQQYVFARLFAPAIRALARLDREYETVAEPDRTQPPRRAIHRIWPDFEVRALVHRSVRTIKADAAQASFAALGDGIVWAVADSGIDGGHLHFKDHENLTKDPDDWHAAFTTDDTDPLVDEFGHGTHVAGIIAGERRASPEEPIEARERIRDENGTIKYEPLPLSSISGVAPKCRLVSLKVLNREGTGLASNLVAAIEHVQRINEYGRRIRIHGLNMSVGYQFEPEWFACGQSPLCREVNRLARSGVVVVVAAGNTGYGWTESAFRGTVSAGLDLTINDPGNAEHAITVGSTHRDSPHTYGVSYFSSKGPTGDGRMKPDLVAPGEKIVSCSAGKQKRETEKETRGKSEYIDQSGTSMAAPHVSGAIAAFLSIRQEFIGETERVKEIFTDAATDLGRDRYFQGHGMVDLMRAIQSV